MFEVSYVNCITLGMARDMADEKAVWFSFKLNKSEILSAINSKTALEMKKGV